MDMRLTLRYLWLPNNRATYLSRDNKTLVDSSMFPHSRLHKQHKILSYHRVQDAIAAKSHNFIHIPGTIVPADILSKSWVYQRVWNILSNVVLRE